MPTSRLCVANGTHARITTDTRIAPLFGQRPRGPQSGQALQRQIGLQKSARLSKPGERSFRREIAAANSAFHCRGPARLRPIASKIQILDTEFLAGSPTIHARLRRKRGVNFLDYGGFLKLRFAR